MHENRLIVKTENELIYVAGILDNYVGRIGFDLETNRLNPFRHNHIVGYGLYLSEIDVAFYFPVRHINVTLTPFGEQHTDNPDNMSPDAVRIMLNSLSPRQVYFENWNIKFDAHFSRKEGIHFERFKWYDPMIGCHLANENEPNYRLKPTGVRHLGYDADKEQQEMKAIGDSIKAERKGQIKKWLKEYKDDDIIVERLKELNKYYNSWKVEEHLAELDIETVGRYVMQDAILSCQLSDKFQDDLAQDGLSHLWEETAGEYVKAIQSLEYNGILVDEPYCLEQIEACSKTAYQLEKEIIEEAKEGEIFHGITDFNPGSPLQVARILGLQNADEAALDSCNTPMAKKILEYRKYKKADSTYFGPYLNLKDGEGYLHPSLLIHGTVAGRLSSRAPNAQNVPREDDRFNVRGAFIAPPGQVLLSFDYSQIEYRVMAHYCQDPTMVNAYMNDIDMHQATADLLGVSRQDAKTLNFAVLYGAGPDKIAGMLGVSSKEGRRIVGNYKERFPNVDEFTSKVNYHAKKYMEIKLWTGRKRRYNEEWECHTATNNLIQGGAAEIMRHAICRLYRKFERDKNAPKMILQIHDDILFYAGEDNYMEYVPIIQHEMSNFKFRVPIKAEGKVGTRWSEMEKL